MEIGAKMATEQEKSPKNSHKTLFFSTGSFGVSQHIGTLILSQSAFLRIVMSQAIDLC